jgi:hypothetical protein
LVEAAANIDQAWAGVQLEAAGDSRGKESLDMTAGTTDREFQQQMRIVPAATATCNPSFF